MPDLPYVFPCGCSLRKVEAGFCDMYQPDGNLREPDSRAATPFLEALGTLAWDTEGDEEQAAGQLLGVIEAARRLASTMTLEQFAGVLEHIGEAEFGAKWPTLAAQLRKDLPPTILDSSKGGRDA